MLDAPFEENYVPITSLTKVQRRVLGVLIEKGFTTPDQYPLTLKATTTACNQKNNRDPLSAYDEDQVMEALEQLRALGLSAVVHTESGRTERYRHWMRKRYPKMTEPQLAVLGELWLRGRQQVGELRSRASRMHPIESLEELRTALEGLLAQKFVQSDGSLDRRGAEVDHNWYEPREGAKLAEHREPEPAVQSPPPSPAAITPRPQASPPAAATPPSSAPAVSIAALSNEMARRIDALEQTIQELRSTNRDLDSELLRLRDDVRRLSSAFDTLRQDLGG